MKYLDFKVYAPKLFSMLLLALFVFAAACSDDDADEIKLLGVKLSDNSTLGKVLTDSEGLSLYFFANDATGASTCNGACAATWPPFLLQDDELPEGLLAADFGEVTRADGSKQTTYKGWPLYYFTGDDAAGEVNGEGSGGTWFVAKPDYTLMLAKINSQLVFVGSKGKAVYTFDNDTQNTSNCSGGCVDTWPPYFYGETIVVPSTLNSSNFGTITRADGTKQNTYAGKPLYLFSGDETRGTVLGNGLGNVWHVIVKN